MARLSKAATALYDASPEVRAKQAAYKRSPEGKEAAKRYKRSASHKAAEFRYRLKKYGLTQEKFDNFLISQDNKCAVCKRSEPGGQGTWHIDHDHECCPDNSSCGQCVRGLLCWQCNYALGLLQDSPEILHRAGVYISSNRQMLEAA